MFGQDVLCASEQNLRAQVEPDATSGYFRPKIERAEDSKQEQLVKEEDFARRGSSVQDKASIT